jgi:succinate-semialdehyde dehydrogenase/glutarate-semialdehyde dehydrogenase
VATGADLVLGGTIPDSDGWWYPATVLENVQPGMPASQEEIFGPVVALVRAEDTNHAVALSCDTRFGLGDAIFSADSEMAAQIAAD